MVDFISIFIFILKHFLVPTAETLFLLVLSILAMESTHSIRFLYRYFSSSITSKLLNTFYYTRVDYSRFMNITVFMNLKLVSERLQSQPLFLCIMIAKFGKKFEDISKLFDHTAHNGFNYLNGRCFVFQYGKNSKSFIWQSHLDTVCGKRKPPSWNWL